MSVDNTLSDFFHEWRFNADSYLEQIQLSTSLSSLREHYLEKNIY